MAIVSLKYIAERILRILEKGDVSKDVQLDPRDIMPIIREETAFVMKGEWMNLKNQKDNSVNAQFVATFEADVEYDNIRKQFFAKLPVIPISLPDNTGVRSVRPVTNDPDKNMAMIPIPPDAMDLYGSMDAGFLEGMWGYEIDRGKVWFTNKPERTLADDNIKKVRMRLVTISPEDTPEDAPYPLPPDLLSDVITRTLERLGVFLSEQKDVLADEQDT